MGIEDGGIYRGQVTGEFIQLGKTQVTLHVSELEAGFCDPTGGSGATPVVQTLWDLHAGGTAGET